MMQSLAKSLPTGLTLTLALAAGSVHAEVRMLYPFQPGGSILNLNYDTHEYPAFDIDTNGHPTVYAPISGTVIQVISADYEDNYLTGNELLALTNSKCTSKTLAYGNRIKIQAYDGTTVLLAHLHKGSALVTQGAQVQAGQAIAEAGSSGWICASATGIGDHLHIEYRDGQNVAYEPPGRFCDPLKFPSDDPGTCDVGNGPPGNETCDDGLQNQAETGIDCGGPCPPCQGPVCADGDRRRCWVECTQQAQQYPQGCIFVNGPLLMGIETCQGNQWGLCEMADGITCADLSYECINGSFLPASYECMDGGLRDGGYTCIGALGAQCNASFYSGWPPHDCPQDLCLSGEDACLIDNETRPCEIHCNSPDGMVIQGSQTCVSYCGSNLAWSSCNPNLVNDVTTCL